MQVPQPVFHNSEVWNTCNNTTHMMNQPKVEEIKICDPPLANEGLLPWSIAVYQITQSLMV